MDNISYHGTNTKSAESIIAQPSRLDVNKGKGELGKGFYTGSSIALAAIWAQNRFGNDGIVIKFDIPELKFVKLVGHTIKTQSLVRDGWNMMKANGTVATRIYGYDYIIAPFALIEHVANQYKFESTKAESELRLSNKTIYPCGS